MADEQAMPGGLITLDPTKWVEPKESFIGKVEVLARSDTDQSKTKEGQTFTEFLGLPRPKRQLRIVIERLDAVYKNKETGELSPLKRYCTLDLERYSDKDPVDHGMGKGWTVMPKGNNKTFFTLDKWAGKGIKLEPDPTVNQGIVCEFEYLRSKMFGGGNAAKDIIYPVKVLALPGKEYNFLGEVTEIEFDPAKNEASGITLDDAAAGVEGSNSGPAIGAGAPKADMLDEAAVKALLEEAGITSGEDEDAIGKFVKDHKAQLPAAIKTALVTGDFFSA